MSLRHQIVRFALADIFLPEPTKVAMQLHHCDRLEGEVIDLSDRGAQREAFAVVQVAGLAQPLLVPVERVEIAPASA